MLVLTLLLVSPLLQNVLMVNGHKQSHMWLAMLFILLADFIQQPLTEPLVLMHQHMKQVVLQMVA